MSIAAALAVVRTHQGAVGVLHLVDIALIVVVFVLLLVTVRVAVHDLHRLDVSVHSRGAIAILHGDPNEALVAPVAAPGVLDDPVGLVTLVFKANNGDAVIKTGWAVVLLGKDAGLVVAPATVAGSDGDAQRTVLELLLHVPIADFFGGASLGLRHDSLAVLVSTATVPGLVVVGRLGLRADFGRHLPIVGHPAAGAAVGSLVAVDALLLGEADDWGIVLDGLHRFLDRSGGEGPA